VPSRRSVLIAALTLLAPRCPAQAAWPDRPVHLIVPYSPGGGVDVTGRLLAQTLTERLGETVLVENHPGAGSNVGNAFVARAAPDGYTLLLATPSAAINASLYRSLPYDIQKDLVPVAGVASSELVLVVAPDGPYHTLADLLAAARARPGKLSYGSAGVGSTEHLAGELLKQLAGLDVLHVPYKGTGQAMNDLRGGQVQFIFGGAAGLVPLVRDGQLRALAVTSAHRPLDLPDIPTMREGGVPGYEITIWSGVFAPKGTPAPVIDQLNNPLTAASRDLADRFGALGGRPMPMTQAQLEALLTTQIELWRKVITQANVHVD
jgi:tripartite-type tricarboxylate transporter receptor subunit TctC